MKLLVEDRGNYVEFDQSDVDFVNSLVAPYARAVLNDDSTSIRVIGNENKYCNVGILNLTSAYDKAVMEHIIEKHRGVRVQFNNDGSIVWAYKRNID